MSRERSQKQTNVDPFGPATADRAGEVPAAVRAALEHPEELMAESGRWPERAQE